MNILVTGGAGFIGSHLTDRLIQLGHKVIIVDNLSTGKKQNINPRATFCEMDINDKELEQAFKKHQPEFVFHLAAQIDVRKSVKDPLFDANSNIMGTINLLSKSRDFKVKKFIFSSSGGVIYGDTETPATEQRPPNPISPYGVAKLAGEGYVKNFGEWEGLPYSILRYANVYGPRQDPKGEAGVVSIFIRQLHKGEKSILYGDGKLERDYVYVDDIVRANILCLQKNNQAIYNIGTGIATSVDTLYSKISNIINKEGEKEYAPKRAGELERNVLNITKAKTELGWEPQVSLDDGLRKTYEWYVKNE
jgi:UDP-glucose 4-epimerase